MIALSVKLMQPTDPTLLTDAIGNILSRVDVRY